MFRFNTAKFSFQLLAAGLMSLYLAQTSAANLAFFQPQTLNKPNTPLTAAAQNAVIPALVHSFAFPAERKIESKQIWVGEKVLFQVTARKSLTSTTLPVSKKFAKQIRWAKDLGLRISLLVILQSEKALPLRRDFSGSARLNRSA